MIIDAKTYGGPCSCGKNHGLETQFVLVEAGCLRNADHHLEAYGICGFRAVIYDRNTYAACEGSRPGADQEIILEPEGLHADEHGVEAVMSRLDKRVQVLVAVGSGTVHDITRYCAYLKKIPFVSCPTAASVDGFCSSVAAMTWEGAKKTLTAVSPVLVLADVDIIAKAPMFLARSGFGDMIGKYIALADWRMAKCLVGEFYCPRIADIMEQATQAVLTSVDGIALGDTEAFGTLIYGLLLSGIAMQMMGNSRPASGGEHHISHCIEMAPDGLGVHSDALHGEKVGVGTLMAAREYHRLAQLSADCWGDYPGLTGDEIFAVYGERLSRQIAEENRTDCAAGITADQIRACWPQLQAEIASIPPAEELLAAFGKIGAMTTLEELGVPQRAEQDLLDVSPMVRNRLTLMRLRRCLK